MEWPRWAACWKGSGVTNVTVCFGVFIHHCSQSFQNMSVHNFSNWEVFGESKFHGREEISVIFPLLCPIWNCPSCHCQGAEVAAGLRSCECSELSQTPLGQNAVPWPGCSTGSAQTMHPYRPSGGKQVQRLVPSWVECVCIVSEHSVPQHCWIPVAISCRLKAVQGGGREGMESRWQPSKFIFFSVGFFTSFLHFWIPEVSLTSQEWD